MSTTNRAMDTVPSNSFQPSVPINADLTILDAAIYGITTIEFATDANRTLTAAEADCAVLRITDSPVTLTADRDLVFPARFPAMLVQNTTAQTITLKKSGQTGVTLATGAEAIVFAGSTDVVKFSGGAFTGGALSSALNEAKGSDIASAATTDIGAATGNFVHVTGTTTITTLGTVQAGTRRIVRFAGALTLTHNATSLILPTGANITTAANDAAVFVSEGSGNWRCVGYQKADGTALSGGGGGGLTNWTDAVNTSAPNATIPAASLTATNAATHVDAVLAAKGSQGATLAQVPDNGTGGGNKRGNRATDWQKSRSANTQVASGTDSTVGGGLNNTASQTAATVAGGTTNTASGSAATVGGGTSNTASNSNSTVAGGTGNTASGNYSNVAGGNANTAGGAGSHVGGGISNNASGSFGTIAGGNSNACAGDNSWCPGGSSSTARGLQGVGSRASGMFASAGDAQSQCFVLRCSTTDATQTSLTADSSAGGTTNQAVLPNSSAYIVKGTVVARQNSTGDTKSWEFTAHIKRGANAAATALVAAATVTAIANDAGAAAWALAVDADTTNGCLRIRGTGEAAKTINWVCDIYSAAQVVG